MLSRPLGSDPADPRRGLAALTFTHRSYLVRTALDMVRLYPEVGPVAIWPHGVPADWTALALALSRS